MSFAEQLRVWRKVAGEPPRGEFSQAAAARHLGVPLATYENWEQGRNEPPAYALAAILARMKERPEKA